jgi:hypothetical protein
MDSNPRTLQELSFVGPETSSIPEAVGSFCIKPKGKAMLLSWLLLLLI